MKKILFIFLCILNTVFLFSESEGEKLYRQNKPSEAIPLLEAEIFADTASPNAYNFLGICYYQIGNYEKSIEVFQKGLSVSGTNKKVLAFNAGNSCYAAKDYKKAIEYFSLAISADPNYSSAVLNRANSCLMDAQYENAISDYKKFLLLEPNDSQKPQIAKMIDLLSTELVRLEEERLLREEEERRFAEEERKMQEELARLEEEKAEQERLKREEEERIAAEKRAEEERIAAEKRAAEEERRRKLLEEVAASLQNTDSINMSSGAEDLIDYEQESELD